jgi:orotate phosphoribosyltransferase-like protein
MENSDEVVWAVFSRIAVAPELGVLRDSLALFIHQNLLKHPAENAKSDIKVNLEKLSLLAKRCKLAKKALANVSGELFK